MKRKQKPVCYEREGAKNAESIGRNAIPVDRMVEKARKSLASEKVERPDIDLFNVDGYHGT